MAVLLLFLGDSFTSHGYLWGSDSDFVKDYLQPAATFALALAIASFPFTLPMGVKAMSDVWVGGTISVNHNNSCAD